MEITFYYAPNSSAVPVASALAELAVPHKRVHIDITKGEQKAPSYLKVNPVGRVPAMEVDGKPMFEALAIMQWLGERFGVEKGLWPKAGTEEAMDAHTWSAWAYVSYGSAVHQLALATMPSSDLAKREGSAAWKERARTECHLQLGALDKRLAKTGYLVGDGFSLVDVIASGVVLWSSIVGISLADFPHAAKWAAMCMQRPSIKNEFSE